jgi:hypothetical protein
MTRRIALFSALLALSLAANCWAMGAGQSRQPADPLPHGQENWEPPEKQFESQYPQAEGIEGNPQQQKREQRPYGGAGGLQEDVTKPKEWRGRSPGTTGARTTSRDRQGQQGQAGNGTAPGQ